SSRNGAAPGIEPAEEAPARVLIVDDDESVMLTMQAVLQMDGYDVTGVMKGSEALGLIRRESFDLVLTDLRLDDLDGLTILAELRERMEELSRARDEIAGLYQGAQRHVEELQELDRQKSKFLSMASHELKTPLTAISGFVQLLLRRTRRRLDRGQAAGEDWTQ